MDIDGNAIKGLIDLPNFLPETEVPGGPPEVVLLRPSETREVEEAVLPLDGLGLGNLLGWTLTLTLTLAVEADVIELVLVW